MDAWREHSGSGIFSPERPALAGELCVSQQPVYREVPRIVFRSRWVRAVLLLALLGFAWLMLAGWEVDSSRGRTGSVVLVAFALVLALGIAMPVRARWALRTSAGAISAAYLAYLRVEVWAMLHGKPQSLRRSDANAINALRGVLTFGVPLLLFAFGRRTGPDDHSARSTAGDASADRGPAG
jgi:hypothetical protein